MRREIDLSLLPRGTANTEVYYVYFSTCTYCMLNTYTHHIVDNNMYYVYNIYNLETTNVRRLTIFVFLRLVLFS